MDEIRQDGKTVLSGSNGISIPMFFNNLTGKSFGGKEYPIYSLTRDGLPSGKH